MICRVCGNPLRCDVDQLLASGEALSVISTEFKISEEDLSRHLEHYNLPNPGVIEAHPGGLNHKPDPRCRCCRDPQHDDYDRAYLKGELSQRSYADKVGCDQKSVSRHVNGHLPKLLTKATEIQEVVRADNLVSQIGYYEGEARRYKSEAESQGDIELALKAVDRALRCIEIYAKVQGLIQEQPQINLLINNPEWVEVRTLVVRALEHYPAAREAVVNAIRGR